MSTGIVSTLPNELLTKIFSLFQDPLSIHPRRQFSVYLLNLKTKCLDWTVVTHVCRHWRNVALEDPTLWSHIDIHLGPRWTEQFLQRARMAPLAIDYRFPSPYIAGDMPDHYNRLATTLSCHVDHVQQLVIDGTASKLIPVLECLNAPAPLLQSAVVSASRYGPDIAMPTALFGGNAPRLRQLRLDGAAILWTSLTAFTTLTHLDIQLAEKAGLHGMGAFEMTRGHDGFETFLCVLGQLTALEKLALHHSIPSLSLDSGPRAVTRPAVALPNLKWLRLHLDVVTFVATMDHLVVPGNTRIDLNLSMPRTNNMYDLALTWLRSYTPNFAPVQSFALSECLPGGVRIVAGDTCNLSPDAPLWKNFDEDDAPMLRMVLRSDHRPRYFLDQMKRFCEVLHLEDVRRIDVFINMYWMPQDWLDFFGGSRRVEYALVGSKCAQSFFDALTGDYSTDDAPNFPLADVELLFPSLSHLELRAMDFYADVGGDECMWEVVCDALWLRRDIAPLDTMKIQGCRLWAEEADRFRDIVLHFSWDEEGAGYATSESYITYSDDDDDL